MDEADFQQARDETQQELSALWEEYLETVRESGRLPSVSDFAYFIPYSRGFQQGVNVQLDLTDGFIVALTGHSDQAVLRRAACEHCKAEVDMPCVGENGRALDFALFHVARYRAANINEEAASELRRRPGTCEARGVALRRARGGDDQEECCRHN